MPESKFLERGCQEKTFLPAPRGDVDVVTYIQPHLILRGVIGLAALARRTFQRQHQPLAIGRLLVKLLPAGKP